MGANLKVISLSSGIRPFSLRQDHVTWNGSEKVRTLLLDLIAVPGLNQSSKFRPVALCSIPQLHVPRWLLAVLSIPGTAVKTTLAGQPVLRQESFPHRRAVPCLEAEGESARDNGPQFRSR